MQPEDVDPGDCVVYPENQLAVAVFIAMATQWRHGPGGITGFDYAVLPVVMDFCEVEQEVRRDVFADVRLMEGTVISMVAEQRKDG